MRSYFFILILLCLQINATLFKIRLSIGPAWHAFNSRQFFLPQVNARGTALELLQSEIAMFPYGQINCTLPIKDTNRLGAYVGGGRLKRGSGLFTGYTLDDPTIFTATPLIASSSVTASTLLANVFFEQSLLCACDSSLNFLIGYAYNRENPIFFTEFPQLTFAMRNRWQGPLFGVSALYEPSELYTIRAWYFCTISWLQSLLRVTPTTTLPDFYLIISDAQKSSRTAKALGNTCGIDVTYALCDGLNIGTNFMYIQYANRNAGHVQFSSLNVDNFSVQKELIKSSCFKNITWQQFSWTLFLEFIF